MYQDIHAYRKNKNHSKLRSRRKFKKILEAGDGIEPTIKALQASALPLCYPAKMEKRL